MNASLHQVTKITLHEICPLREDGAAEGPIMSYVRNIVIEYEDDARLVLVCHADDADDLAAKHVWSGVPGTGGGI